MAELDELRLQFFRKAALAGQDRVARPLVDAGVGPDELADTDPGRGAAVAGPDPAAASAGRRSGLPHDDDAPLLIHADGSRVTPAQVPLHLRRARLQRIGIETNGEYCKSLLQDALRAREWLAVSRSADRAAGRSRAGLPCG